MEVFGYNTKKILIFSQKEAFLIFLEIKKNCVFPKMELSNSNIKKILMFSQKRSCLYVSGKGNPEKILYISGGNLQTLKIKKILHFSKLKHFFILTTKHFFSFYNIFFYTQQAFVFHFLRDFCNVYDHIFFSFSSLDKF